MRIDRLTGLISFALLCGCMQPGRCADAPAGPPAGSPTQTSDIEAADANAPATPAPPVLCNIRMLGRSVHPGEDAQFIFTVKANSPWCFGGVSLNNGIAGNSVTTPPSHGTLRLVPSAQALIFSYRPAAGYTGTDAFRISVPGNFGGVYFAGHVTVEP